LKRTLRALRIEKWRVSAQLTSTSEWIAPVKVEMGYSAGDGAFFDDLALELGDGTKTLYSNRPNAVDVSKPRRASEKSCRDAWRRGDLDQGA
jgi:hypothetical protein